MISQSNSFHLMKTQDLIFNKKTDPLLKNYSSNEICPNCGNSVSMLQSFKDGMLVCFVCRKASAKTNQQQIYAY